MARSMFDSFLSFVSRSLAVGALLLVAYLGPALLVTAGVLHGEPLAAVAGLAVLAISAPLTWMVAAGQRRLRRTFRALSERTGLAVVEVPDVLPGLAHLSLRGVRGRRSCSIGFENHVALGHVPGVDAPHRRRSRGYVVVRAHTSHPTAEGACRVVGLEDARAVAEALGAVPRDLLQWLVGGPRHPLVLGGGTVGFRLDVPVTPSGLEEAAERLDAAVALAERWEACRHGDPRAGSRGAQGREETRG